MSYPPPPGLKLTSTPQAPTSLPARPPPPASNGAFRAALSAQATSNHGGHGQYAARAVGGGQNDWRNQSPSISAAPAMASNYASPTVGYGGGHYQQQSYPQQQKQQPQMYQQQMQEQQSYGPSPTPQIHNPFPMPGQHGGSIASQANAPGYDPEMEAQIAQWQSAYGGRDDTNNQRGGNIVPGPASAGGANALPLGPRPTPFNTSETTPAPKVEPAAPALGPDGKPKTVVRSGGGETWQDSSLLEWDPAHFRLFVGNLAGEVTDDSLLKAFSKFESVQKARVVRDKRTTKSKGFGFVSFSDGDQYFQAVKDMQGKYIGSHPVLLKRATTEVKPTTPADKNRNKYKNKKGGKGGKAGGEWNGSAAGGHADTNAGIKKGSKNKTWNGLKILG